MRIIKYIIFCFLYFPINSIAVVENSAPIDHEAILRVSPEMKAFLSCMEFKRKGQESRMNMLLRELVLKDGLGFTYDRNLTLTAAEAFNVKRGNCLSFAYLYVAMGREIGLDVRFNRVDIPPKYSPMGRLMVETKHINVLVKISQDYYAIDLVPSYRDIMLCQADIIEDKMAFSSYYSNLGVNAVSQEDNEMAEQMFQKALSLDRNYTGNLRNLGLLYKINKNYAEAEKHLLTAAELDKSDSIIYFVLSEVYKETGDNKQSEYFLDVARKYRRNNPFYYYANGLKYIAISDWDNASRDLKTAIRLCDKCHYMYYDLAYVYERQGRIDKTRKALELAILSASTDELVDHYQETLDSVDAHYKEVGQNEVGFMVAMR